MRLAAIATLAFVLGLPGMAWAASDRDDSIRGEIRADLEEARQEIRTELAQARIELETGNLDVGNSLQFNGNGRRKPEPDPELPRAEITPQGDFLIDGQAVAIDAAQRRRLLDYRGQVIEIARTGIDIGEVTALAAMESVDRGVFSLMVGAMTGSLERKIERTVRKTVEPGVLQICDRMPALRVTQQQLASELPAFQPYARLEVEDADTCRDDVRRGLAQR